MDGLAIFNRLSYYSIATNSIIHHVGISTIFFIITLIGKYCDMPDAAAKGLTGTFFHYEYLFCTFGICVEQGSAPWKGKALYKLHGTDFAIHLKCKYLKKPAIDCRRFLRYTACYLRKKLTPFTIGAGTFGTINKAEDFQKITSGSSPDCKKFMQTGARIIR
ncbi:hypothetical protein [Heyndrickxia acidiproducens]|uniref:hypothetical protein n=1 Tax=Heyndrickxia acidiproducens TaxID=1121084 RepID=UPI00037553DE|nr:hypothetical protein [Heyndrickxia acidiproducens]